MKRPFPAGVVCAVLLWASLARAGTAHGAGSFAPPGSTGYDLSFPECGATPPADGAFGIVGVTNGLPFSSNSCLLTEYQWAAGRGNAALYMNTANPAPASSFYWPASGARDPALCIDSGSTSDPGCAYDYGWHAAADALMRARSTIGAAAGMLPWWLDVETANSWNGDPLSNAADIQGAGDYLRSQGVPSVGIYSTGYQWDTIAKFGPGSMATYVSRWQPELTPKFPLDQWPLWAAGASTLAQAQANCRGAFTGAPVQIAQYRAGGADHDLVCPILGARGRLPALACDSCTGGGPGMFVAQIGGGA